MELHQLEYFREVAHRQHVTQAAERLSISQPAISRSISRLEQELGMPLLDRQGRSVRLNRYGRAFLVHVERALAEIAEGRRELADLVGPLRGAVSIGFIRMFGTQLLPEILSRYREQHPGVEFQLSQGSTGTLLDQLASGETDLCLLAINQERPDLHWIPLFREEIFAVLPAGHRLAGKPRVKLKDLAQESFITFKQGWGLRQLNEELCAKAGFSPRATFEGEDLGTVQGLVAAGLGVALLPPTPAPDERAAWLHVSEPRCERRIGIAWIRNRYLSAVASSFRDFIVESLVPSENEGQTAG